MNSLQFVILILFILVGGPLVNLLIQMSREKEPSSFWVGNFSLILGDDTVIPVTGSNVAESVLSKGSVLKGLILHGVPAGRMPFVVFGAYDQESYELQMFSSKVSKGEVKILLKIPWTSRSFPTEIFFYSDVRIPNLALEDKTGKYVAARSGLGKCFCGSLQLSFKK